MKKIIELNKLSEIVKKEQEGGAKIVLVHGFFDILHRGHVNLFEEAKILGDILVVGIDHDDNAQIMKGPGRPINNHDNRMFLVSHIDLVDYVFLIPSVKKIENAKQIFSFYCEIYSILNPDMVTTNIDAGIHGGYKEKQAKTLGIEFVNIGHNFSDVKTSKILEKLKRSKS